MTIAVRRDGLDTPDGSLLGFFDAVLRGVGQVMFQNNTYAGLLFLLGISLNSIPDGLATLYGSLVSTATAVLLGAPRAAIRVGLHGFNGALTALALVHFLGPNMLVWVYLTVAAAFSTVLMLALTNVWKVWDGSALTAPFVLTAWVFLFAAPSLSQLPVTTLPAAVLPVAAGPQVPISSSILVEGLFHGIGQVFFQGSIVTGVVFLVGLLVASRIAAIAAILGSLVGLLIAWGLSASTAEIQLGLCGYNPTLTAMALGGIFFPLQVRSLALALLCTISTVVVTASLSWLLRPVGMIALTAPFVLVVWGALLAKSVIVPADASSVSLISALRQKCGTSTQLGQRSSGEEESASARSVGVQIRKSSISGHPEVANT